MVGEHCDGSLHRCLENVVAKLMQPSELVQPSKLVRISKRYVMGNVVADEAFEHWVFEDRQRPFRPDRLDGLVAESFVFRRITDQVDGAIGTIKGVMFGIVVLISPIGDDDICLHT